MEVINPPSPSAVYPYMYYLGRCYFIRCPTIAHHKVMLCRSKVAKPLVGK